MRPPTSEPDAEYMLTTTPDSIRTTAEDRSRARLADARATRLARRLRRPAAPRSPVP